MKLQFNAIQSLRLDALSEPVTDLCVLRNSSHSAGNSTHFICDSYHLSGDSSHLAANQEDDVCRYDG
ncbi:MAG: hypothetical protein ABIU05_01360 [Nitrospirales bacterium]